MKELANEIFENVIITSGVFRTGIVVMTIAFIKMLIPFYKYNVRMKSFHESRRYSLRLSGIKDLKRVKVFADVLATEKLDFEKDDVKLSDLKPGK
jgi:hypothetical protein